MEMGGGMIIEITLQGNAPEQGIVILGQRYDRSFITTQGLMSFVHLKEHYLWRPITQEKWNSFDMSPDDYIRFLNILGAK